MTQRVAPLDATFLHAEHAAATLHVGGVLTFASGGFDVAAFTESVGRRLAAAPRLRQVVRAVPFGAPVWVDDHRFDLHFHVRHVALPSPGTAALLRELVDAVLETPLDRTRPLWELYVVEGLQDGRTALVVKVHHAVADGLACMQLGGILLDATPEPRPAPGDDWRPAAVPSDLSLAVGAARDALRGTRSTLGGLLDAARSWPDAVPPAGLLGTAGSLRDIATPAGLLAAARSPRVRGALGSALDVALRAAGPAPVPALRVATPGRRRHGALRATLADHRAVRRAHGGTVNDVVLAVVAGGLRRWLAGRGAPATDVRAMVPVSGRDRGPVGNHISAHLVDLPVATADPLQRLVAVRAAMDERKRRGPVAVDALAAVAGAVPPVLHELGARVAGRYGGRLFDVLVSNVPGPPRTLYAGGAALLDLVPVVPLAAGQAVAVGVASYAGALHYGVTVDGTVIPDPTSLTAALEESLAELVVRSPRPARTHRTALGSNITVAL